MGPGGSPVYVEVGLPELDSEAAGREAAAAILGEGADAIKVFTGSFVGVGQVVHLPLPALQAVTSEARAAGKPVLAHPQTHEGTWRAIRGGVNAIIHTAPGDGPWPDSLVHALVSANVALAPTLSLWRWEYPRYDVPPPVVDRLEDAAVAQVRDFLDAGGDLLFGTDVGYMVQYDPGHEYELMARAGASWDQILRALTDAPATFWGDQDSGRVEPGMRADLVLLGTDPRTDISAFVAVDLVMRDGMVILSR